MVGEWVNADPIQVECSGQENCLHNCIVRATQHRNGAGTVVADVDLVGAWVDGNEGRFAANRNWAADDRIRLTVDHRHTVAAIIGHVDAVGDRVDGNTVWHAADGYRCHNRIGRCVDDGDIVRVTVGNIHHAIDRIVSGAVGRPTNWDRRGNRQPIGTIQHTHRPWHAQACEVGHIQPSRGDGNTVGLAADTVNADDGWRAAWRWR